MKTSWIFLKRSLYYWMYMWFVLLNIHGFSVKFEVGTLKPIYKVLSKPCDNVDKRVISENFFLFWWPLVCRTLVAFNKLRSDDQKFFYMPKLFLNKAEISEKHVHCDQDHEQDHDLHLLISCSW